MSGVLVLRNLTFKITNCKKFGEKPFAFALYGISFVELTFMRNFLFLAVRRAWG